MDTLSKVLGVYLLSQINTLFDLAVPKQSTEHEKCFLKVLNHLRRLYQIAPDYFDSNYVDRIVRYKIRHNEVNAIREHEKAPYLFALNRAGKTNYEALFDRCSSVEDLVTIVMNQAQEGQLDQIYGSDSLGISTKQHEENRTTYCRNCKKWLHSGLEQKCAKCGWILCTCGACGCSW